MPAWTGPMRERETGGMDPLVAGRGGRCQSNGRPTGLPSPPLPVSNAWHMMPEEVLSHSHRSANCCI